MHVRLMLTLLLLDSTGAQGGETEGARATLRGLEGVHVMVENLEPSASGLAHRSHGLPDHLGRLEEEGGSHGQAEGLGGFQVDD